MPTFEISIPNLDRLLQNFKRYPAISERWLQRAIEASIAELHKKATRGTVPWRTGRLVQSFGEGIKIGRLWGKIGPTANYASAVYYGTRPHIIERRNKMVLADRRAGIIFGKRVQHPGTRPNRFLDRMIDLAQPAISKHFKAAGDNITNEISKL